MSPHLDSFIQLLSHQEGYVFLGKSLRAKFMDNRHYLPKNSEDHTFVFGEFSKEITQFLLRRLWDDIVRMYVWYRTGSYMFNAR